MDQAMAMALSTQALVYRTRTRTRTTQMLFRCHGFLWFPVAFGQTPCSRLSLFYFSCSLTEC